MNPNGDESDTDHHAALYHPLLAELEVTPVINAGGAKSKFGGRPPKPILRDAVNDFWDIALDLEELNRSVGHQVAKITGSQDAMVVNGAAGGTMLATLAMLGSANGLRLMPEEAIQFDRNEIIVMRPHRGQYSYLLSWPGGKIVDVGYFNRLNKSHLEAALTPRTCGIMFLAGPGVSPIGLSLAEVTEFARLHRLPVFVSAAATLPPRNHLKDYISDGADLVAMSGGKYLGATQTSGLLFGREDLIELARASTHPNHGLGRALKLSKEDIISAYLALKDYVEENEEERLANEVAFLTPLAQRIQSETSVTTTVELDTFRYFFPAIAIQCDIETIDATRLYEKLLAGNPRVFVRLYADCNVVALERTCTSDQLFHIAIDKIIEALNEH